MERIVVLWEEFVGKMNSLASAAEWWVVVGIEVRMAVESVVEFVVDIDVLA